MYYATKAETIQLNEDSQQMFYNCSELIDLDLSNFNTSNVTNMNGIFAWCSKLEEINLNWCDFRNTSVNMMNMTYWWLPLLKKINMQNTKFSWSLASAFAWLSNVEEIYLSWANTSNVTNMGSMFGWCSKLEKLDLEWWILTWNISNMFGWLSTLKEINLDWVNTKWVTNMSSMFWGCSSLILLDLSSFDTSNVTTMNQMFNGCSNLENLDLSNWNTSNLTDVYGIFAWCSKLEELNLRGWDFSKTSVNMMNMTFWWLPLLKKINMQNTKFSWSLSSAFASLNKVEEINLSWADVRNVTNMWWMFSNCSKLEKLNLNWWYFTWSIGGLFAWLSWLSEISLNWVDTKWVTNMWGMFSSCSSLTWLDLSNWDTSNVMSMWWMFYWCKNLKSLNLSWWNFEKINAVNFVGMLFGESSSAAVTQLKDLNLTNTKFSWSMERAFYHMGYLENLILDGVDTSKVTNMSYMIYECSSLTWLNLSSFDTSNVTNMACMFEWSNKLQSLDVSSFNTSNVTGMYQMFKYYNWTSLDLSNFDTSKVINMNAIFAWCRDLENLNLSWWDFRKVATTNWWHTDGLMYKLWFYGWDKLRKLNMTNAKFTWSLLRAFDDLNKLEEIKLDWVNTEWVTNMSYMFDDCRSLKNLDVSSFDTSNVTDMSYMFFYCNSLTWLDLSNFDTSKVINMSCMFDNCSELKSLNLDNWNLSELTSYGGMFSSANSLEKVLARNWVIPRRPVTLWCEESQLCASGLEMDVSNWNLSNTRDLSRLFANSRAKEIKWLDTWNTSSITWMYYMFGNCKLTWLDLSSWDTSNLQNYTVMFNGCTSLETLNLDWWDLRKIVISNYINNGVLVNTPKLKKLSAKWWKLPENFYDWISRYWGNSSIEEIDVSNWDLSQTKVLDWLFWDSKVKVIKWLDTWDTSNVTVMSELFSNCSNLTWLDLSTWDTSNVTTMGAMFSWCNSLENLNLDNWKINNSSSTIWSMFKGDNNIKTISLKNWTIPENLTHAIWCRTSNLCATWLESIDVSNWNLSGTKNLNWVFWDLYAKEIKWLETWDTSNITDMWNMFYRSYNITWLDLSNFDTSNVTNMYSMFYNTSNLKTIYASENFVTTALSWDNSSKDMFSWTTSVVWWNGTKFDPNYIDEEYAKIDKVWQTWYFTDKNAINVKFINTLDWTETTSTFAKWQKLTPPPVNGYHAVWWYIDETMTQEIDLNKWVDSYTVIYVKYDHNGSSGWWGGGWGWNSSSNKTGSASSQTWNQINSNTWDATSTWINIKEPETNIGSNIQTWSQVNPSEQTTQNDESNIQDSPTSSQNDGKTYSTEFQEAYEFAKWNGITTMPTIQKANMEWKLTRIAMAKMLSQYAINVLWKTPDTSKTVKFKDVSNKKDADYDNWVTLAYQLWIMWQNMPWNKFRPNDEVTRAEFATALSRMAYNTSDWEYKATSKYYIHHMEKLVKEWIITNDNPNMKELRWYVMIMLMRSAKN